MTELNRSVLLLQTLNFLRTFGLNPYDRVDVRYIMVHSMIILQFVFVALAASYDIYLGTNLDSSFEDMYFLSGYVMVISKYVWLIFKRRLLVELLNEVKTMWSINMFGSKMFEKYNHFYRKIFLFCKTFVIVFDLTMVPYVLLKSINKETLMPGYYANLNVYFLFVYHSFSIIVILNLHLIFLVVFIYFVSIIYVQAGLIKESLKNLGSLDNHLPEIVSQHIKVLNFMDRLRKAYFDILFVLFMTMLATMVFALNVMTNKSYSLKWHMLYLFGVIYANLTVETAVYCFGGMIIDEQLKSIGYEAYNVKWFECNPKLGKALILVMLRAQNSETFKAANMVNVDMNTFTEIITNSFKICAFIQTIERISTK